MTNTIDRTVALLAERRGPSFHELPAATGPIAALKRILGMEQHTHYYERLDGSRVHLTKEEASQMSPIELELASKEVALSMMRTRQRHGMQQ